MKRKLITTLVVAVLAAALSFFIYFIVQNELSKPDLSEEVFILEDIDISMIDNDIEFAQAIPEYNILFTGLIENETTIDFTGILENNQNRIEDFSAAGIRSDGEMVEEDFKGINLKYLIEGLGMQQEAKNLIIYATDLFAAQFTLEEISGEDIYLVWKKNGEYLNPTGDGILKIVVNDGPTEKWVKNPVLFDFIGPFDDQVPDRDDVTSRDIDFISEQNFFTLSLGFVPEIDIDKWMLTIGGLVEDPAKLTYDQILEMPQKSVFATLETISNPPGGSSIGNAVWTGVPFEHILDLVSPGENVIEVAFYCDDGYSTSVTMAEAIREGVILAYKMNGQILADYHGFPIRMVIPEKYGMKWPKWINEIEFIDYDYKGYWEQRGWSDYAGRDRPEERYD